MEKVSITNRAETLKSPYMGLFLFFNILFTVLLFMLQHVNIQKEQPYTREEQYHAKGYLFLHGAFYKTAD